MVFILSLILILILILIFIQSIYSSNISAQFGGKKKKKKRSKKKKKSNKSKKKKKGKSNSGSSLSNPPPPKNEDPPPDPIDEDLPPDPIDILAPLEKKLEYIKKYIYYSGIDNISSIENDISKINKTVSTITNNISDIGNNYTNISYLINSRIKQTPFYGIISALYTDFDQNVSAFNNLLKTLYQTDLNTINTIFKYFIKINNLIGNSINDVFFVVDKRDKGAEKTIYIVIKIITDAIDTNYYLFYNLDKDGKKIPLSHAPLICSISEHSSKNFEDNSDYRLICPYDVFSFLPNDKCLVLKSYSAFIGDGSKNIKFGDILIKNNYQTMQFQKITCSSSINIILLFNISSVKNKQLVVREDNIFAVVGIYNNGINGHFTLCKVNKNNGDKENIYMHSEYTIYRDNEMTREEENTPLSEMKKKIKSIPFLGDNNGLFVKDCIDSSHNIIYNAGDIISITDLNYSKYKEFIYTNNTAAGPMDFDNFIELLFTKIRASKAIKYLYYFIEVEISKILIKYMPSIFYDITTSLEDAEKSNNSIQFKEYSDKKRSLIEKENKDFNQIYRDILDRLKKYEELFDRGNSVIKKAVWCKDCLNPNIVYIANNSDFNDIFYQINIDIKKKFLILDNSPTCPLYELCKKVNKSLNLILKDNKIGDNIAGDIADKSNSI
jgi:hypothetical protein